MKTPISKSQSKQPLIATLLVVGILVVGLVVWSLTSMKEQSLRQNQPLPPSNVINNENGPSKTTNTGKGAPQENRKEETSQEREQTQNGGESSNRGSNSSESSINTQTSEIPPPLCFVKLSSSCVINEDDPLFALLGKSSTGNGLWVGGLLIKPKKIVYKTSYDTYPDEQLKDAAGKVLLSTNKTHNEKTGVLTITVGLDKTYYKSLDAKGRRSFPNSQLVRSFLAMLKDNPDNYIKVEQVVKSLGDWRP